MLSGETCMLPMWKKMPVVHKQFSLPNKTPSKLKPPAACVVPTGLNGKESETEGCPDTFCPRHGLWAGASFTRWCFCGQGLLRMLPGSLRKTWSGLCCKLNSEVLLGTCKRFPPQAMLWITKVCLQLDRDVYVFVAGYMLCERRFWIRI